MADLKFLSTEWVEKTEKILREKITPQSTNNATLSIALTVENLPDKQEKTLVFETDKGKHQTDNQTRYDTHQHDPTSVQPHVQLLSAFGVARHSSFQ